MKKFIISSFLLVGIYPYSQVVTEMPPYYLSGDAELEAKGYTDSPKSYPPEKPYVADYASNTRKVVERINGEKPILTENEDTMTKIINSSNDKIDINEGYVNVEDSYDIQNDGTLKPKYEVYKKGVNNEQYNQALKTQEHIKTYKSVKKEAKDVLPLILLILLVIACIYLILFLRKKLKY